MLVSFQATGWPADPQGHGCHRHWLSASYRQLFLVPALCKCQAVQVCYGQGSNRCRRVDVQTCRPCWRTQDARRSRTVEARFQRLDVVWFVQGTAINGGSCPEKHQAGHHRRAVGADAFVIARCSLPQRLWPVANTCYSMNSIKINPKTACTDHCPKWILSRISRS